MEYIVFTRTCLSFVRVVMVFMSVPLVELLCQTVLVQISALKCRLSSAHGILRPRPISLSNKCYRSRSPGAGSAYPVEEAPGWDD
jgi:hypothetical protein